MCVSAERGLSFCCECAALEQGVSLVRVGPQHLARGFAGGAYCTGQGRAGSGAVVCLLCHSQGSVSSLLVCAAVHVACFPGVCLWLFLGGFGCVCCAMAVAQYAACWAALLCV